MITLQNLNKQEALRYLGYGTHQADENVKKLLEACEKEIIETAVPKYLYKKFNITLTQEGIQVENTALFLKGKDIENHLADCFGVFVLCATLSANIDKQIRQAQLTDMTRALVLDSLASVAVEQVCDDVEKLIDREEKNVFRTWRFSPGYGDFPIETQKDILNILDAPRKIGLYTGESSMLMPVKSITAIIGLSNEKLKKENKGCISCNLRETCQFRKEGNRCV